MTEPNGDWLAKRALEECSIQFRTVWDIYIKWYTVFLTFNIVALGVAAQHLDRDTDKVVALVFIAENLISLFTGLKIGQFSAETKAKADGIAAWLTAADARFNPVANSSSVDFPIPGKLGLWSGLANAFSHLFLIACWVGMYLLAADPT